MLSSGYNKIDRHFSLNLYLLMEAPVETQNLHASNFHHANDGMQPRNHTEYRAKNQFDGLYGRLHPAS